MEKLTPKQIEYLFEEIKSHLSYYGVDNPSDRANCANEILYDIQHLEEE